MRAFTSALNCSASRLMPKILCSRLSQSSIFLNSSSNFESVTITSSGVVFSPRPSVLTASDHSFRQSASRCSVSACTCTCAFISSAMAEIFASSSPWRRATFSSLSWTVSQRSTSSPNVSSSVEGFSPRASRCRLSSPRCSSIRPWSFSMRALCSPILSSRCRTFPYCSSHALISLGVSGSMPAGAQAVFHSSAVRASVRCASLRSASRVAISPLSFSACTRRAAYSATRAASLRRRSAVSSACSTDAS